jgi:hypothetical protein
MVTDAYQLRHEPATTTLAPRQRLAGPSQSDDRDNRSDPAVGVIDSERRGGLRQGGLAVPEPLFVRPTNEPPQRGRQVRTSII